MQVVTERPFDAANETVWFGAAPLGPVRRPTLPQRKPMLAGHVVAVGGAAMKAARRPRESGPGVTHGPANLVLWRCARDLRPRPDRALTGGRRGEPSATRAARDPV